MAAALLVILLGLALGVHELLQRNWIAGAGYFSSALLTAGLLLFGTRFIKESWIGATLALATMSFGLYGFFLGNRGLDPRLDLARFEAGLALFQAGNSCPSAAQRDLFQRAATACSIQSSKDKLAAIADGVKEVYLPPQLDFTDKVLATAAGDRADPCRRLFAQAYEECPAAFSSMSHEEVDRLLSDQ